MELENQQYAINNNISRMTWENAAEPKVAAGEPALS